MRFKPSQTTPSFLDQRSQLRMLSYVGLISLVIVTVSLMKGRTSTSNQTAKSNSELSADDPRMQVHREERTLKPDEVIIVANPARDGTIELTIGDSETTDPHIQLVSDGTELFKRRGHERERTDDNEMFRTRAHQPARKHGDAFEDNEALDEMLNQNGRPDENPGAAIEDPAAIPLDPEPEAIDLNDPFDKNNGVSDLRFRKKTEIENPEPPREPSRRTTPTFDDQDLDADEFIKRPATNPPSSKKIFQDDPSDVVAPPETFEEVVPERKLPRHQPKETFEDPQPEEVERFKDDFRATPPERSRLPERSRPVEQPRPELPRRDDLFMDEESDRQPFRKEVASVEIDKSYLELVRDNDLGIRKSESKTFYWLLDHARRVSSKKLERAGLKEVQYINLITEPSRFRGEPISIEGDLWKLYEFDAGPNDYGVDRMYEAWVFTGDSGHHPYRVVCTSLGKGIEPGDNLRVPVRLTGYFFKREGYESNGGVHIAPTLLARHITVNPTPNGIPQMAGFVPYTVGTLMAVGLALLVSIISFAISDERTVRSSASRWRREPQLSFAGMSVPSPISVEQSLREYAEHQRQAAISGAYGPLLSRQTALEHGVHSYSGSRSTFGDNGTPQRQRPASVLQDWAARQKEAASDTFVAAASPLTTDDVFDDELRSDRLAPARHPLHRPETWAEPRKSTYTPATPAPAPSVAPRPKFETNTTTSSDHRTYETRQTPPVSSPIPASNISYGASKLSEYEAEIAKMSNRSQANHESDSAHSTSLSAEDQIERDRMIRESEIRERMQRQHAETDRTRLEQIERDRLEFDRLNQEALNHDHQSKSDRQPTDAIDEYTDYDYEESEYDAGSPATDETENRHPKKRGGGWGWPKRRDEQSKSNDQSDASASDNSSDDSGNQSSFGWGRRRKKHKR